MVAVAGLITMWSSAPAPTCSEAVAVFVPFVPVTVCAPPTAAVQVAPVQEPFGAIENVVVDVTSPSELSYWSRPSAVYACEPRDAIVAEAGARTRWSSAAAVTVSDAVAVAPESLPMTVWGPALVAVQTFAVHEPSGEIAKFVDAVTSNELPFVSKPVAVYVCGAPAATDAVAGPIVM